MARLQSKSEIANVIVCEDIRHELNHKFTLVGVYVGDIVVQNFPAIAVKIAVYAEFKVSPGAHHPFTMTFRYGGEERVKLQGTVQNPSGQDAVVASPQLNVSMVEEGDLEIHVSVGEGGAEKTVKKHVSKGVVNLLGLVSPPT